MRRANSAEKQAALRGMIEPSIRPRLPSIDATAVIQEDDPDVLLSYARGLWQQWQAETASARARAAEQAVDDAKRRAGEARRAALAIRRRVRLSRRISKEETKETDEAVVVAWRLRAAVRDAEADARRSDVSAAPMALRKGYTQTKVRAALVWLVGAYADACLPIPYELSRLIRAVVDPDPAADTHAPVQAANREAYRAAILYEAKHPGVTAYRIAKHLRNTGKFFTSQESATATVKSWRKSGEYSAQVIFHTGPKRPST